ncbi:MAG: hypothetical protein IJD39_01145 [Clostridia bacterium]|nr:hypothetical protein [Clostridia bacterium]
MPTYGELVQKYQKRQKAHIADSVAAGLSYADNLAVDLGLMEESGLMDAVSGALPFVCIAVTEQMKVILGKKTQKAGISDGVQRMLKTGAAMSVGAIASVLGGPAAAVPAAAGARLLINHYRSKAMLNLRIQERTQRLQALRQRRDQFSAASEEGRIALPAGMEWIGEE